jgi:hypothetical protein
MIVFVFFSYGMHIEILLSGKDGVGDAVAIVEDVMAWANHNALLNSPLDGPRGKIARELLLTCCNMVTVGVCDVNFIGHVIELCSDILDKGLSYGLKHFDFIRFLICIDNLFGRYWR